MTKVRAVTAGSVHFGNPKAFVLIGGLCVLESESIAFRHAEKLLKIAGECDVPFVFKASYDKANRSSCKSFRGPGMKEGLKILAKIKKEFQIPILSDIHIPEEAGPAAEILDILQIPAFLCRQTDLILAAGKTGKIVNVKKGQFLSPWETQNIIHKLESVGCRQILLTERGFSFGYNNLVSDFRSIAIMRGFGYPVVYDATHSVQLPGGGGDVSGGAAEFIPLLSRCAVVSGADALFMEVHEDPSKALSDGANALKLSDLPDLLKELRRLKEAVLGQEEVVT